MSSPRPKRYALLNTIGAAFYLVGAISWMWACLPFLPKLLQLASWLQPEAAPARSTPAPSLQLPPLTATIIAVVVTVVMLGVTIYILVKLPKAVGKTGHKITTQATQYVVPVLSHHAQLSPKKRRLLTARVMVYLKLTFCLLPVALAAMSIFITQSLPYSLTVIVATLLCLVTLLLLTLQLVAVRLLHVSFERVW